MHREIVLLSVSTAAVFLLQACSYVDSATYPADWPSMGVGNRCDLDGQYANAGDVRGSQPAPTPALATAYLDALLSKGVSGPSGASADIETIALTGANENLGAQPNARLGVSRDNARISIPARCSPDTGYVLSFTASVQSEPAAAQRTAVLTLLPALNGDLVIQCTLKFKSKSVLLPHTVQEQLWYRFRRTGIVPTR